MKCDVYVGGVVLNSKSFSLINVVIFGFIAVIVDAVDTEVVIVIADVASISAGTNADVCSTLFLSLSLSIQQAQCF